MGSYDINLANESYPKMVTSHLITASCINYYNAVTSCLGSEYDIQTDVLNNLTLILRVVNGDCQSIYVCTEVCTLLIR